MLLRKHGPGTASPPPVARQAGAATPGVPHAPRRTSHSAADASNDIPGLPAPVVQQLQAGRVVVVALYDPNAKVDVTAKQEAGAGATLAHAAFVAVDVTGRQID